MRVPPILRSRVAPFAASVTWNVAEAPRLLPVLVFVGPWLASLAIGGGMFGGGGRRAREAQPLSPDA